MSRGTPGTGKSQTIANMIVQLLAAGKTVLFVSQKTTALDVVRRRLDAVGVGDYCLEVHSAKAQKSAVLGQLKTAWDRRAESLETDWATATRDLRQLRDELNALVGALHRPRANGMTAHQAMGRVIALRDLAPDLRLSFGSAQTHERAALDSLREALRDLLIALRAIGSPPLRGVGQSAPIDWAIAKRAKRAIARRAVQGKEMVMSLVGARQATAIIATIQDCSKKSEDWS